MPVFFVFSGVWHVAWNLWSMWRFLTAPLGVVGRLSTRFRSLSTQVENVTAICSMHISLFGK